MAAPRGALERGLKPRAKVVHVAAVAAALAPDIESAHGELAHGTARTGGPPERRRRAAAPDVHRRRPLVELIDTRIVALLDDGVGVAEEAEALQLRHIPKGPSLHSWGWHQRTLEWTQRSGEDCARLGVASLCVVADKGRDDGCHALDERIARRGRTKHRPRCQ